jgi:hypothetical protein
VALAVVAVMWCTGVVSVGEHVLGHHSLVFVPEHVTVIHVVGRRVGEGAERDVSRMVSAGAMKMVSFHPRCCGAGVSPFPTSTANCVPWMWKLWARSELFEIVHD